MILRPAYIEAIRPFIGQPLVKILAGVRRCGKTTIFAMIVNELIQQGIPKEQIIQRRYTEMDIPADISAKDMYNDLRSQINTGDKYYFFFRFGPGVPRMVKTRQQFNGDNVFR